MRRRAATIRDLRAQDKLGKQVELETARWTAIAQREVPALNELVRRASLPALCRSCRRVRSRRRRRGTVSLS